MAAGIRHQLRFERCTRGELDIYTNCFCCRILMVHHRVPKELISRFVKLCPTCQTRRGTRPEMDKDAPESANEVQSPEAYSVVPSRKGSGSTRQSSVGTNLPLQRNSFKALSTFQQQNRWMTPLHPQTDSNNVSPTSMHNPVSRHDSYNTMPPIPMSCPNGNPPGLPFSFVNTYGESNGTPGAYASSSLSQSTHGHVPTGTAYDVKVETHYI